MSDSVVLDSPSAPSGDGGTGPASGRRRAAPLIALAVAVVIAALFAILATSNSNSGDEAVSNFAVGKAAPTMITTTLDGKPFDLSRRKGSWVVLNFFQSSCLPCKAEHPELVKFVQQQASLGTQGAELYTVISADTDANVRSWFRDNGGIWPILHDTNGTIAVSLGVAKIPETWVVDPQGIMVAHFPGATDADTLSRTLQTLREREA
jgi:cytochrome c biogenesis protein CcmG/thiol:disulfide interchange protein DsbE